MRHAVGQGDGVGGIYGGGAAGAADNQTDGRFQIRPLPAFPARADGTIESLALLRQFEQDRQTALRLVLDHLVFISDAELSHLVRTAYQDWIVGAHAAVSEEYEIHRFVSSRSLVIGVSNSCASPPFTWD